MYPFLLLGMIRDSEGKPLILGLISDNGNQNATSKETEQSLNRYYDILRGLGLLILFEPRSQRIILSKEVNGEKPDEKIFRLLLTKFKKAFLTKMWFSLIIAADKLGMIAIQFQGSGKPRRKVNKLIDLFH